MQGQRALKLVLLNLKYSPNLGDGIIAECLEAVLREHNPEIEVSSCDIAGRTSYGEGINHSRAVLLSLLERVPGRLRRALVSLSLRPIVELKLRQHYRSGLQDADAAILGGGQLIADADLNFPIKISAVADMARGLGVPFGVYGVGIGKQCSEKGLELFRQALASQAFIACLRDQGSANRWNDMFAPPNATVVNDPGLLASQVWPTSETRSRVRPLIGIGVTNPSTLNMHADHPGYDHQEWRDFFRHLSMGLLDRGYDVKFFTNGAYDDFRFAASVRANLPRELLSNDRVRIASEVRHPSDLAKLISQLDGLVAHRLHAGILAYSYGVPHVGLGWDCKLDAFFRSMGRERFMKSDWRPNAATVAKAIEDALEAGICDDRRHSVIEETKAQIVQLGKWLSHGMTENNRKDAIAQPEYHHSSSPA